MDGSPSGDWVQCLAGMNGIDGNFSADPLFCNVDHQANPVDVVYMVNFVYKDQDARVPRSFCPSEAGDTNCDGQVNPVDVVYFVNYIYKDQNAFCAPCGE